MNVFIKKIGTNVAKTASKVKFWSKRKSPELLIATGILAAAGSVAFAIKATLKLEDKLGGINKNIKDIRLKMEDENLLANGQYSVQLGKKELTKAYGKAVLDITKLYGPAALCFTASVVAIMGSHRVMKGRMAGLAAAYTTVERAFGSYRERVANKIGKNAELDIYQNNFKEDREVEVDDKDGETKTSKRKIKQPHIDENSYFVWIFDASHTEWSRYGKLNIDWLMYAEKHLNEKLRLQGHLFLWDVYRELGVEPNQLGKRKLQASRVLGWIYDPEDPNRDNYISFGLSDAEGNLNEHAMEAVRGDAKDIFVEFNPDGDILTGSGTGKDFTNFTNVIN